MTDRTFPWHDYPWQLSNHDFIQLARADEHFAKPKPCASCVALQARIDELEAKLVALSVLILK
jgi:hypothetical protein